MKITRPWPRRRGRIERIVEAKLESGKTILVDVNVLRGYLHLLENEEFKDITGIDADVRDVRKAVASVEASERASLPRNDVTRADLVRYKEKYEMNEGKSHGWKTRACKDLRISLKTLNDRWSKKE